MRFAKDKNTAFNKKLGIHYDFDFKSITIMAGTKRYYIFFNIRKNGKDDTGIR